MPYRLCVEDHFSSAHNLRGYKGSCEKLHGHNWKVEIIVTADTLDKTGMGIDFRLLKKHLKKILDSLDHRCLNDISYFKKNNPSSENIARYIFEKLFLVLKKKNARLSEVKVWESDGAAASYLP